MSASGAITHTAPWMVWLAANWWWVLIIIVSWGGAMVESIRDFFIDLAEILVTRKTKHELELRRTELKLEKQREKNAALEQANRVTPGPCVHRRVVPVIPANSDTPVAWLCKNCEARLPADWAVREEDL